MRVYTCDVKEDLEAGVLMIAMVTSVMYSIYATHASLMAYTDGRTETKLETRIVVVVQSVPWSQNHISGILRFEIAVSL